MLNLEKQTNKSTKTKYRTNKRIVKQKKSREYLKAEDPLELAAKSASPEAAASSAPMTSSAATSFLTPVSVSFPASLLTPISASLPAPEVLEADSTTAW